MHIVVETGRELTPSMRAELWRYRHHVFVRELGWKLPIIPRGPDQECDQFDTERTVYVVAKHEDGRIGGCARLLPTTHPYLLGSIFPGLLATSPPPRCETIWELSRFAARGPLARRGDLGAARQVFAHALLAAHERGAFAVVGVLSLAVARICRKIGAQPELLGEPQWQGGECLVACIVHLARERALLELARQTRRTRLTTSHASVRNVGTPEPAQSWA